MQEIVGNIWDYHDTHHICVTTNGMVKSNGELVMGAGLAKQAAERFPHLPKYFGELIQMWGNIPFLDIENKIFSLPTKHHYKSKSRISLIISSLKEINYLCRIHNVDKVITVQPGCGLGGLKWEDVKPQIEHLLDDKYTVISPS